MAMNASQCFITSYDDGDIFECRGSHVLALANSDAWIFWESFR
jgi:hypothetical protein